MCHSKSVSNEDNNEEEHIMEILLSLAPVLTVVAISLVVLVVLVCYIESETHDSLKEDKF